MILRGGGGAALNLWLAQKDDLLSGRTPRAKSDGLTVRELCNRFLTSKRGKLESGELVAVAFHDYYAACKRIIGAFGKNGRSERKGCRYGRL